MRVGIFTDVYFPYISGVVTAVDSLDKALTKKGCETFIISINSDNKKYEKVGNLIKIPAMKVPKSLYDYYYKMTFPYKAIKLVKELNLDIIHTNTEGTIGIFGKYMGRKLKIPVVHTMHTMYEQCVDYITRGHFKHIGNIGAQALVKLFLTKTVNYVITPGIKPYNLLKDKYKIKQEVKVIPNGINLEQFNKKYTKKEILNKKKELGLENDFLILWVGRLGYEKNIKFMIENHRSIISKYKNCKLLIVGAGPEEDKLKTLVKEYNLDNYVIFTGSVPNEKVNLYYNIADVFVSASTFETQGLTLIEALSCSLPVVCINDLSFNNIITNKKDGIIFKDNKEYVKSILYLINNPNKLLKMKEEALNTSSKYSLDYFGDEVLSIYNKVLKDYTCKNK